MVDSYYICIRLQYVFIDYISENQRLITCLVNEINLTGFLVLEHPMAIYFYFLCVCFFS